MNKIIIEKANIKDINELYKIELLSFEKPWQFIYFYYCFFNNNILILKAILNRKIVGFIITNQEEDSVHILNLAVNPKYRNLKIGSMLIETILNNKSYEKIYIFYLEVRKNNIIAINLYKKYGFVIEKVLKNYYGNNEDGYLMVLYR
jgi:ribosomal-protein-alanine N-acetyltransferase